MARYGTQVARYGIMAAPRTGYTNVGGRREGVRGESERSSAVRLSVLPHAVRAARYRTRMARNNNHINNNNNTFWPRYGHK
eukprot:1622511-Rhodomonas_salina.1